MLQVVWFKRDLRLKDHQPLSVATKSGPVLAIYVVEPSIWLHGDLSKRHFRFVLESLQSLDLGLRKCGTPIFTAVAEMETVLESIFSQYGPFRLLAHEENGASNTFARDVRVHRWMREKGLSFVEFQHFGVKRRLANRNAFQKEWERFMNEEMHAIPARIVGVHPSPAMLLQPGVRIRDFEQQIPGEPILRGQRGGEHEAENVFVEFLHQRSRSYQTHLSYPFESMQSCSRISTYLAWGNLSIRDVVHRTHDAISFASSNHRWHLQSFLSRLQWHCHFIQRIEDDPRLDSVTMNRAYEGIRTVDEKKLAAWSEGRTGFPIVDASIRCLKETGWLHFRGRAMLVSFVCNTLLQDWRQPASILSQWFLDYEPGIHFSQIQMQAGTTGFNTIRIYNPTKHSMEHDPHGKFIRHFLPELQHVSLEEIHEPWKCFDPETIGYVSPIIDLTEANRAARDTLWGVRKHPDTKEEAARLLEKHGSRRSRNPSRRGKNHAVQNASTEKYEQLSLEFD